MLNEKLADAEEDDRAAEAGGGKREVGKEALAGAAVDAAADTASVVCQNSV